MKATRLLPVVALFTIALAGCSPVTVPSPFTGKPVTGDQLVSEIAKEEARIAKEEIGEKAKAQAEIRSLTAKAEAEVRRIAADAKIADAQRERELADITAAASARTQDVLLTIEASKAARDSAIASLRGQADDAFAALEAAQAQRGALAKVVGSIPIVGQYAGMAGVGKDDVSTILTLLVGGGAVGWMNKRAKAREDAAWDESQAKARADAELLRAYLSQPPKGQS